MGVVSAMSTMGLNADGTWSKCKAKPENRGRYNCHHVCGHLDGIDPATMNAIAENVARFNKTGSSTGSLNKKKPAKSNYTRKNTISNNGDAAEIIANIDIITGEAVFDHSMPYSPEDVEFIEIQGIDDSGDHWTMKIYKTGMIEKNPGGQQYQVDLGELRQLSTTMKQTLLYNTAIISRAQSKIQNVKHETHNYKSIRKNNLDAFEQGVVNNLNEQKKIAKDDKNNKLTATAQQISELLGIPGGRLMKSLGEKADVKIGLKSRTEDKIDPVSTKSWFGGSNPSLHSAGSRTGEVSFIGVIPKGVSRSDLAKAINLANNKSSDREKLEILRNAGVEFDKNNAIVMNKDYSQSLELMSEEQGVDARKGLFGACWQCINGDESTDTNKLTRIGTLPGDEQAGFLAVAYTLGAAEYNPGDGVYDPKKDKIKTFAEVDDKTMGEDGKKLARTVLKHREEDDEKQFLLEQASISTSNYSQNNSGVKARITMVGDAVMLPVNLSIQLRHEQSGSKKETFDPSKVSTGEFVCSECFLVKHRSQLAYTTPDGQPVCKECA